MRSERPSRHIGFHQLLDAIRLGGCPVCRLVEWAVSRLLSSLFHGLVNDPGLRDQLRQAAGFCFRHVEAAVRAGNPLGGSIIYADVARHVAAHLDETPVACPCCTAEATTVSNAIATLLEHIREDDLRAAYEAGGGLCLPHLRQALSQRDASGRALLEQIEGDKLSHLAGECEALVAKSDYEHIGEELGPERDAWKRAAQKLAGN